MKKCLLIFGLFLCNFLFAQKKTIIVFDKVAKNPIENVSVYYPLTGEGNITNEDGKTIIIPRNEDLIVSHINYGELKISANQLSSIDTLFLTQRAMELKEVIISSFDLKKALTYVLDNYKNLYIDYATEKECSFKETMKFDNEYKRLILSKINWWSKSYEFKNKNNYNRFLKLRLGSIDQFKNIPLGIFKDTTKEQKSSGSGFIEPKNLVNNLYLNNVLTGFLKYCGELSQTIEASDKDQIVVSFESDWKTIDNVEYMFKGKVVFDKATKAIINFTDEINNKNRITKKIDSISNKEYSYETASSVANYNFYKNFDNKWTTRQIDILVNSILTFNGIRHIATFINSLYVLKETKTKSVNDDGLIDLNNAIYKSLPSTTIANSNTILLSEKEQAFISK